MRCLLLLIAFVFTPGRLVAEDITSRDFAAGYYLETSNINAVYSVELPEDVFHTVKSAALNDVRVFNSAGEVVPHEIRTIVTDPTSLRDKEIIPFFPLFQLNASDDDPVEISLLVARDTTGAIVNIKPNPKHNPAEKKITGYLLDLSQVKKEVSELSFSWQKDLDSSVFTVKILESNDLQRWTPLVHQAALADLQFAGQLVERRSVELPQQPMKYLKLIWEDSSWPLKLTGVAGYSNVLESRRKRHWISLYNGTVHEKDNRMIVDFTTGYRLPTSSVQVHFPERNSVAMLLVQSRPDAKTEWRWRCEQVFHDLSFAGTTVQNEPCDFPPTSDLLWQVVVKQDGAGLQKGKGALTLRLGWQPSELLFVGRGTPPYLLAFGSSKLAQQANSQGNGMLLQVISREPAQQSISPATIGKKIALSGELALKEPAPPTPWKKWLLWVVLVLGVGLLAYMARILIKEMKTADEKKVAGK